MQISNEIFDSLEIKNEVPKNSGLVPIFVIYINDFNKFSNIKTILYVDNVTFCFKYKSRGKMQE